MSSQSTATMDPTKNPERPHRGLGLLLVLAGLTANQWSVGWTFSSAGVLTNPKTLAALYTLQFLAVAMGAWLWRRSKPLGAAWISAPLGALALISACFFGYQSTQYYNYRKSSDAQVSLLKSISRSEDLLQWLTPQLRRLNTAALNLEFPDARARALFDENIISVDLAPEPDEPQAHADGLVRSQHWGPAAESKSSSREELTLLAGLLERVDYFEHAKFYLARGAFDEDDERSFLTHAGFSGLARTPGGGVVYASGSLEIDWRNHTAPGEEDEDWRIEAWRTKGFELEHANTELYEDATLRVIRDPKKRHAARRSIHEEMVLRDLIDEDWTPPEWFTHQSHDRHPGISIADVDGDGLDDMYVMARWGRNLLFINRGDGTFDEQAEAFGLDLDGATAAAILADFDNDGDVDAMLGRTLEPSVYLVNEGGRFIDRTEDLVEGGLPMLVSSVAAADYDGDGLLDVYFSTYASRMINTLITDGDNDLPLARLGANVANGKLLEGFLPEEQAVELCDRFYNTGHSVHDRAGPPNVLLRNLGNGRFGVAPGAEPLQAWHHTYQSTWADYDGDGDQDVYVANDFAPNNLIRNNGDGTWTDVTEETNAADIGFGMGAGWGDYDNDGDQDLYVANMFSKAGRRITAQIPELSPVFGLMARGNSLLELTDGRFERVSGLEPPHMMVEKAGWSWGGQFLDFNNDGYLDLYALSGNYTAPPEVEIPVDT